MDNKTQQKNRILLIGLILIALLSIAGAIGWFNIYAPLVLTNH